MKSIKDIIERYKDQVPSYWSVIGFLNWGGKNWFEINSNDPVNLNSTSKEFIKNKKGQIETYYYVERVSGRTITVKEWGKTLDQYYPHPYFPDQKPAWIETIRILPGKPIGSILKVTKGNIALCMEYPEFYKPIYL